MQRYDPTVIEPKWQKVWTDKHSYNAKDFDSKPKYVMLTEFPYPSGDGLHLGHIREYTYGDILARYQRTKGFNVLYPMGYDAFGLPTENYAIKNKITPEQATDQNIAIFQKQFERLGFSIDWTRSFRTTDPKYYKWTQWLFLQIFNAGLAYQDEIAINWCPHCKTGLANEEVINGRHERCDTIVEKKILKQWLLKITDYADKLIDGLKNVDYPSRIADQQINWIGKSDGASIKFKIENHEDSIEIFTTAHDTIFGVTFMVLAPEHPLVNKLTTKENNSTVKTYIKKTQAKTDLERLEEKADKTGVFSGSFAINPINNKKVPIWIADYVLSTYGTGAIMAVPGQDERDYEYAKKYNLEIIYTTHLNKFVNYQTKVKQNRSNFKLANSNEFDGLNYQEGRQKILDKLIELGVGKATVEYKLRDWIFSRQRYWGEPIPIIHCPKDGPVAVPDDQLPVILPKVESYEPTVEGQSPLAQVESWVNTTCPKCGQPAKRETDTMPNWAGSSWYYLRYFDPQNDNEFAEASKLKYWGAVDFYLGGMEHTTLHLLYSRFWHQFLYDHKLVPTPEPYISRRGQGVILAADGSKMSKSKGNVVNPSDIIESGYGADALRLSIAFLAPYDQTTPWNPEGVAGTHRFLQRAWTLVHEFKEKNNQLAENSDNLKRIINKLIFKVTKDLDKLSFNTAIAAMMDSLNQLYLIKAKDEFKNSDWQWAILCFIQVLSPYAPHIVEELWAYLDQTEDLTTKPWPTYDENFVTDVQQTIVIQINGKLRGKLVLPKDTPENEALEKAKNDDKIKKYLVSKQVKNTIFVPNKLINFVTN
ncbi:MAG TPA: leucine--tRNA ligase [Patescibacteria group bacterium]|nr:leucine--tRNA ligase [Patescibacteria group bacterium]